jgi:hypothetical protein
LVGAVVGAVVAAAGGAEVGAAAQADTTITKIIMIEAMVNILLRDIDFFS